MFESPAHRPLQDASKATILLEHAVSMVILGPSKSKNQLILLERMAFEVPVAEYLGICCASLEDKVSKSDVKDPT